MSHGGARPLFQMMIVQVFLNILETWEISNCLSLMIIKRTTSETIYSGVPSCDMVNDLLDAIE